MAVRNTFFFIRRLQVMDEFFKETDWLCSHRRDRVLMAVKNTFFFLYNFWSEIARDGRVLLEESQPPGTHFFISFIRRLQVMDEFSSRAGIWSCDLRANERPWKFEWSPVCRIFKSCTWKRNWEQSPSISLKNSSITCNLLMKKNVFLTAIRTLSPWWELVHHLQFLDEKM